MIWLIGCGNMGINYAKVLINQKKKFVAIGRGNESAFLFEKKIDVKVQRGGLDNYLDTKPSKANSAIVSVQVQFLYDISIKLIDYGIKKILIEKPGSLDKNQLISLDKYANEKQAEIYIAYNRRFYSSVYKAKKIIKEDGGVLSFNFEFTELVNKIKNQDKPSEVKSSLFFNNSSHVVDLAFYLTGDPESISCYTKGELSWHRSSSIFSGSGITKNNIIFSYGANWEAPGRWRLELLTRSKRLIFQPLEKLQIQKRGSFDIKFLSINDEFDIRYKPGVYKMVESFLSNKSSCLKTISDQVKAINYYYKMANYN